MIRILLVDDDEDDFVVLRELLQELGGSAKSQYTLEWEPTYRGAKKSILEKRHEIYLLDYRLGERSGLDLMRECIAAGIEAPFILLTGQGDEETDLRAMQGGASDYLVKTQLTAPLLERSIRYSIHGARVLAELRANEEGFRSLLDSTFEGIVVHDENGAFLQANRAAADIFGLSLDVLMTRDLANLLGGEIKEGEISATRSDGSAMRLEIASKPYTFAGRRARLTAIRDITGRKQLEAQILVQDRLASVGLLASSLAHEIGTPLGVMRGRAELLYNQVGEAPEAQKNIDVIITQIDRISKLIHSLLNLARGDSSKADGYVALDRVLQDVVDLVGHEFKRQGVALETRLPKGEVYVNSQAEQLHQVILNLLVNSLHAIGTAAKQGTPGPFFASVEVVDAGKSWKLSIRDNGCGISAANMRNLFRPFFTTKDIGVGTGLGLANSYRIIEKAGGSISVESEEGNGALFTILLPKASKSG